MALLRNEPIDVRRLPWGQSAGLALLLAAPFTALTSLVMGSVASGLGILGLILIGIAVLGGLFSGLLWVCTHTISLRGFSLAHMALNSLRRRGAALVFAMIALFAGVLSMSLGLVVSQTTALKTSGQPIDFQGYNLTVLGSAGQESAIRQAVQAQNPEKVGVGYRTALEGLNTAGGEPVSDMDAVLVGRTDPADYVISGADWGSQPGGVYVPKWANVQAGSQVEASFLDGATKNFKVVGEYEINYRSNNITPPTDLLMTANDFTKVARADSLTYFVQVAPDQVSRVANTLGAGLPQATVVNLEAYADRFMQGYRNLYVLPMALAGMALLAGFLLVANSVSLAMLDRRYEIGILKTTGYARRQILTVFAVEYGLVGVLATGAGVILIQGLLAAVAIANQMPPTVLLLNLQSMGLIAACGVVLPLLTVLGVTWTPTRVSPMVVLNERN
jgi:predicted lysophospholipase L1 biosynthesis ABC-type transport system permease subunit